MSALFFACYNSQLTEQELFFNDISESESESGSELSSPSTPSKEWPKIPFPQTLIAGK
jgi:hypothetical protein